MKASPLSLLQCSGLYLVCWAIKRGHFLPELGDLFQGLYLPVLFGVPSQPPLCKRMRWNQGRPGVGLETRMSASITSTKPQASELLWCNRSVTSNSLRPHELQHARPPCPSPTPRVHPDLFQRWRNEVRRSHPKLVANPRPYKLGLCSFLLVS